MVLVHCRVYGLVALFAGVCLAGPASQPAELNAAGIDRLKAGLASTDPVSAKEAVSEIRRHMGSNPTSTAWALQRGLLKALIDAKRYDDAAELAAAGIPAVATSAASVEALQAGRVRALLAAGKAGEAVVEAKSLFNVATMAGTGNAILLLGDAVAAAREDDADAGRRYRAEQLLGATTRPGEAPKSESVLSIKVDAAKYGAAIKATTGEDYENLVARGNLLLMADRVADAREAFDAAYSIVDDRRLPAATENLARCMKAEDGTIGRANAWILSLREAKR